MNTTLDGLLNCRLMLEQPAEGFRVAVDTVLLAAAVSARAGERALDLGCGAGGAMLCLAARVPGIVVTGVEIQQELVELCCRNIARNKFQAEIDVVQGDVTRLPAECANAFDHVLTNPPYHDEARHDVSAHPGKRVANTEKEGDLALWVATAVRALKTGGMLTIIHRTDRATEIIALAVAHFGRVEFLPILPKDGAPSKRILLRCQKGGTGPLLKCKPITLHCDEGGYSDEAEGILRHAESLLFEPE